MHPNNYRRLMVIGKGREFVVKFNILHPELYKVSAYLRRNAVMWAVQDLAARKFIEVLSITR